MPCVPDDNYVGSRVGGFSYNYEGKMYSIESLTPESREGYNYLIQKENDKLVLRAIDKEQDGILDKLLVGNISLEGGHQSFRTWPGH